MLVFPFVVLALSSIVAGTASALGPSLAVLPEKVSLLPAEPAWVKIVVKNETAQDLRIHSIDPRQQHLRFVLTSPEGDEVPYSGTFDSSALTTHLLTPGDSLSLRFDLLEAYSWPMRGSQKLGFREMRFLAPGTYALKAYLQGLDIEHGGPGDGTVYSNTIPLEVLVPTGQESAAFGEYRLAVETDLNTPSSQRGPETRLPYLEVAEKYPSSLYARMALIRAAGLSAWYGDIRHSGEDLRRSAEECDLVIERYPGTPEAERAARLREQVLKEIEKADANGKRCPLNSGEE